MTIPTLYIRPTTPTHKIVRVTIPRPSTTPTRKLTTKKIILASSTRKTPLPTTPSSTSKLAKATTAKTNTKFHPSFSYRPKIYFKTSPTTTKIVRRTTTRIRQRTFPIKKPYNPKESEYNDFVDVTIPKDNDEALLITPAPERKIPKQYSSEEVEEKFKFGKPKNISETFKLLTQKETDTDNNNIMAIVVSSIGTVVFIVIVLIVIMKYCRYPRRRGPFSSSISQSDVRFFPNDENLDFSIDNEIYGTL